MSTNHTKHTPGPWQWQTSNSWRRLGSVHGFSDGNVMYPCVQRDGHPDVTFPNGGFEGPDARLIAAAPDLLEALRNLLNTAEIDDGISGCVADARAAIAKATGVRS